MKKFISMLAGVVMASSLFAASAYAAGNVAFSVDATEVNVGETVTFTIDSNAKNISTDGFNIAFDTTKFECVDILDDAGYSIKGEGDEAIYLFMQYKSGRNTVDLVYSCSSLEDAAKNGTVAFYVPQGTAQDINEKAPFAQVVFKAIEAVDNATFTLNENSAGGDKYNGVCDTINVTAKATTVEPPYEPTWKAASSEWTAPEGKKAIWWPVDYAAGEFPGFVTVKVTDGTTTKSVGVGAANGFDIEGAVSFAVAAILDADVDATYFDCVVE